MNFQENKRKEKMAYVCPYLDFEEMMNLHPSRVEVLSCGFPKNQERKKKIHEYFLLNYQLNQGVVL